MKRNYNAPLMELLDMMLDGDMLLNASPGVATGNKPGDEYNQGDVTCSPGYDDEDDDEEDW